MTKKISKVVFPFILFIFFGILFIQSIGLPTASRQLPQLISFIALALLLWQTVEDLRKKPEQTEAGGESEEGEKGPDPWYKNKNLQIGCLIMFYLVAMKIIGYVVATALATTLMMLLLERRGKVVYILGPALALGSWMLFGLVFRLNLPHGFLF